MTQQSNQLQEDGYSIDDFKSGKVEADLKALSGVNDTNLGRPNQTPQSTFDEKVTDTLIDFVFEVYGSILPTDHPELVKSVAAITSLVLKDVIGEDETYDTRPYQFNDHRNHLRAQQRSIITKESE